jgi:4-azaleucine resistance transporter AzlC
MLSAMLQTPDTDASAPSRSSRFRRGVKLGMPVFLGYVPIGAAFGVIATTAGFSLWQAFACSAFVFAGSGQFVAAKLLRDGAGIATVLIATGVLNLRHILFGATVAPYLHETPRRLQLPMAFTLTDEVFAVNITDLQAGTADDYSMIGAGITAWSGWLLGSSIGAAAATLIGDPTKWGVEFAMPAMFTALLVAQITSRRRAIAAGVAAVASLGLSLVLPGAWPAIGAAMLAATVMAVTDR